MDIFAFLNLTGGLCLFLFGMNVMGNALEKRAGGRLKGLMNRMCGNRLTGFMTGLMITAVIQSSSASTVMVVGFVNSGLMTLGQAINVIMGANVGTTVTAWLLSLSGVSSSAVWVRLLKPSSFTPVLALIGVIKYMFRKSARENDTGLILLGFATLMFGMETMSGAVSGLKNMEGFRELFILFSNPAAGVLAGAVLTAVIQSSSASVGILQALAATGQVTYGAAVPIIMGQNIGTCVTALISSAGAGTNAKRAAAVHLLFNIIGTAVCLSVFCAVKYTVSPAVLDAGATMFGIAVTHSVFNVVCTALLLPAARLLERLAVIMVPDKKDTSAGSALLDQRLLATPPIALERCRDVAEEMGKAAADALNMSMACVRDMDISNARAIREAEDLTDRYEDMLGTYLIRLCSLPLTRDDSEQVTALLRYIGDFERMADCAVDILKSAEELIVKNMRFSDEANRELKPLAGALSEMIALSLTAFYGNDESAAAKSAALEGIIDSLRDRLRTRHILRMQTGQCSAEAGFIYSDLLNAAGRATAHCLNIAGCASDISSHRLTPHGTKNTADAEYENIYAEKYAL